MTRPAVGRTVEPVAALTARYDEAYARYRALYPAIAGAVSPRSPEAPGS